MTTEQRLESLAKEEFLDPKREIDPKAILDQLSVLKGEFCTQFGEETQTELIFPEGTNIGGVDFSGKSLEEAINDLMDLLKSYEPPIIREIEEETYKKTEVPRWLEGCEDLIWKGASENPRWEIKAQQFEDTVMVVYSRGQQELKPGKTKTEQGRKLEPIKNSFTLDEWKIAKRIFDDYDKLQRMIDKGGEERKEAKRTILPILKEENRFRKGLGPVPEILKGEVEKALEETVSQTRGFKKEKIDVDALTQQVAEVLSQILVLNFARGTAKERIPMMKPEIKAFPSFEYSSKLLAGILSRQLRDKKGLSLVIGEAGTGKNEALEYLAAATNRPYFWFPCGRGMEAIELAFHYEFDSKEGTKRFLTDLAKGLQTPGAIVFIDEVNALKPEVQAMLHGLGDSNRSLNYDGVHIPVAEGAVVIIGGNPATYGSAGPIGEALLNRTRGYSMIMDYPALRKGELLARKEHWTKETLEQKEQEDNTLRDYACDEAQVLRGQLNEFADLSDEEFVLLWDYIINEEAHAMKISEIDKNPKLRSLVEEGVQRDHVVRVLRDLRDILRIADTWRKEYERRSGGFDILGLSLRDTIAVTKAYKDTSDVRKAYLQVMDDFRKNPIEGLDVTLKALEGLIEKTLGREE